MLTGQPEPPLYFARMKRMNRDGMPLLGGLPTPKKIEDAEELVDMTSSATVIDTRPWDEVREGHLPNTIWSKANADFHRFAGSFVDDSEEIVLIVRAEELDRALRNAIRIGLDKVIAWAEPEVLLQANNLETMPEINACEFDSLENISILDVRRFLEFEAGAIPNAINIAHTRLLDRLSDIDDEQNWVVNCQGGSRSAAACMALRRNGYSVTNLAGGFSGWQKRKESYASV